MNKSISTGILLTLVALIFTIGLTFASVELPVVLDKVIGKHFNFPNLATGQDEITAHREQLYISHYHIRTIGYICLALVIGLIIAGFTLEKKGLASAGALILFLPVFGHFAATMFFLGGLAFLRFLWLPVLDISFDIMSLGDAVLLPFDWILKFFRLFGLNIWTQLPFIITGLGLFIFLLGVIAWMQGRFLKKPVADFWIYRFSRHPQYLGWIIWSYGVLFLPGANMKRYTDVPNSLPWLLTTMIIIAIAMMEERRMRRDFGQEYDSFRERSPFLFPLPRLLRRIFSLPLKLVFKSRYPDTKGQIAAVTGFYTILLICISLFTGGMLKMKPAAGPLTAAEISALVEKAGNTSNRTIIRASVNSLGQGGERAVDSLIALLKHPNPFVRWYGSDALAGSESAKAVRPLIALLDDPDCNVRRAAAGGLGSTGSIEAVDALIDGFLDPDRDLDDAAIARALGRLGSQRAVQPLLRGIQADHPAIKSWSAWALAELGASEAAEPIMRWMETDSTCNYPEIGRALLKLGSPRAEEAFVRGLQSQKWWEVQGCIRGLGETGTDTALDLIISSLDNPEPKIRRMAVDVLGKISSEKARAALQKALEDEDFEVRLYAKDALKTE